jgi:RsiW-degrading membrane proteinase PrsW (M82 family)
MMYQKGASLKWLLNKLLLSFLLTILCSWGLLVFHLGDIDFVQQIIERNARYGPVIDMALRTLTFLGFFMSLYYYSLLRPRLRRVAELVGDRW